MADKGAPSLMKEVDVETARHIAKSTVDVLQSLTIGSERVDQVRRRFDKVFGENGTADVLQ